MQFAEQINGKFQTDLLNAVVENAEIGQYAIEAISTGMMINY